MIAAEIVRPGGHERPATIERIAPAIGGFRRIPRRMSQRGLGTPATRAQIIEHTADHGIGVAAALNVHGILGHVRHATVEQHAMLGLLQDDGAGNEIRRLQRTGQVRRVIPFRMGECQVFEPDVRSTGKFYQRRQTRRDYFRHGRVFTRTR